MEIKNFTVPECLRCPICGTALVKDGGSLRCFGERRHTYDIAKEGYVNLLPPGRAKNARTGDDAEMVKARERFLGGGAYDRYSREAAEFAAGFLDIGDVKPILVDAGCGEGRHTVNMAETVARVTWREVSGEACRDTELNQSKVAPDRDGMVVGSCEVSGEACRDTELNQSKVAPDRDGMAVGLCEVSGEEMPKIAGTGVRAVGFDASKFGVQAAAKRYVRGGAHICDDLPLEAVSCSFFAANIFSMPLIDGCADILTSLFAPLPEDEARRVLKPGGLLLICAAGADHLSEMRGILYDNPIPSGGGAVVPDGFTTLGEKMICYDAELTSHEEIMDLFTMTPFYYNAPAEGRARLEAADSLKITVQVKCTVARRDA